MVWNQQQNDNVNSHSDLAGATQSEASRGHHSGHANSTHKARVLSAGQWTREVLGVKAPFGHDGMPTVWG